MATYLLDIEEHERGDKDDKWKEGRVEEAKPVDRWHQMRGCGCQTRTGSPEQGLGVDEVQNAPGNVEVSLPQSLTEDLVWQSAQQAAQQ